MTEGPLTPAIYYAIIIAIRFKNGLCTFFVIAIAIPINPIEKNLNRKREIGEFSNFLVVVRRGAMVLTCLIYSHLYLEFLCIGYSKPDNDLQCISIFLGVNRVSGVISLSYDLNEMY